MNHVGLLEVLFALAVVIVPVFAFGYYAGKNAGFKEGLREAERLRTGTSKS